MVLAMNVANVAWTRPVPIEIKKFHQSMGHVNKDSLQKMGKYYGIKLYGMFFVFVGQD
jgi:hypothetical protein